jgi:hypothetical protein
MKTEFGSWDKSTRRIPTERSFVPHSTIPQKHMRLLRGYIHTHTLSSTTPLDLEKHTC